MKHSHPIALCLLLLFIATGPALSADDTASDKAAPMPRIVVADDGGKFVFADSKKIFVPWGFNYDHDGSGALLEDYWHEKWKTVEQDFAEMKELGATVVRVHLQFGRFMDSVDEPNAKNLAKLAELLKVAERTGLYLDITGLGCYHKQDVPKWYDELDESKRWQAQANFWRAIAKTCRDSPAVFCYDLMNEPTVPGNQKRDDWLGPGFGGKHFVQFITLSAAGRDRTDIAEAWTKTLVAALREEDKRTLVTVGLVPWSLPDRPGLYSGFDPKRIGRHLDFIAVHLYPRTDKVDEALETLAGFDLGKPLLIEETAALHSSMEQFDQFLEKSSKRAEGYLSFYWGVTPDELAASEELKPRIFLAWLKHFRDKRAALMPRLRQTGPEAP